MFNVRHLPQCCENVIVSARSSTNHYLRSKYERMACGDPTEHSKFASLNLAPENRLWSKNDTISGVLRKFTLYLLMRLLILYWCLAVQSCLVFPAFLWHYV
jgi:hypothetical protein